MMISAIHSINKLAVAALILILTTEVAQGAKVDSNLVNLSSSLQINYAPPVEPPYLTKESLNYYFDGGSGSAKEMVFPNTGLIGNIYIDNITNDTLTFSFSKKPISEYVSLDIKQSKREILKSVKLTSVKYNNDSTLTFQISPKGRHEIVVFCDWNNLVKSGIEKSKYRLMLKKLSLSRKSKHIKTINYKGNYHQFKIMSLTNQMDSLYYFDLMAQNMNRQMKFEEALRYCNDLIAIDSTQFNAYRTAADVLWKMNRFNESISYAQKGIDVLKWQQIVGLKKYAVFTKTDYHFQIMQEFINKCQKREKWEGNK